MSDPLDLIVRNGDNEIRLKLNIDRLLGDIPVENRDQALVKIVEAFSTATSGWLGLLSEASSGVMPFSVILSRWSKTFYSESMILAGYFERILNGETMEQILKEIGEPDQADVQESGPLFDALNGIDFDQILDD